MAESNPGINAENAEKGQIGDKMAESISEINAENAEIGQIGDKMGESNPGINAENAEIVQIGDKMAESNPGINAENAEIVQIGDKMAESNPGINVENTEIVQIGDKMAESNPGINAENAEIVQIGDKMAESNPGINVENAEIAQIGATNTINYTTINQCCHQDKQGIDRPPQNLDVTQVRECLEETYKQMIDVEYYKEVWWSDKFINFHDFFTREHVKIRPRKRNPLRYEESEEQSVILPDDFKELFAYDQRTMKRVCLVGEPGMGKTTQIINLVLSWTSSPTEFLKGFPMLFYIPLNDLPADNACIYKYIFENLLNKKITKNLPVDSFENFVHDNADKAIFLLDGFDELKNDEAKKDIVSVTNELAGAHIVITTRESGGSMIVTNSKFTIASISGFKRKEVIDIMKRKFPQRDAHQLFDLLRSKASPLFQSNYYNPLILYMFCFLYMDEEEITVPSKLTDIYIDLTCFLISKREGIDLSSGCFFDDIENSEALKQICKVAYETLISHQNSFSENRLKPYESKLTALTCKEMSPRQKSDRSVQLRFINKSVQEFLAAVDSVVQFNESGETPWKKCAFDQLPDELEKYGELYPRFMAGLLHRYKHNRGLGELFKTLIDGNLKAFTICEGEYLRELAYRNSFLIALVPDYEHFIELQSESYVLSYELSIYLNEADWPDDAIAEIFQHMGKMLIVDTFSRLQIKMLEKILEHKQCPIEVVHIRDMANELKPGGFSDGEYRTLVTAITRNTSVQGMIFESSDKYDPYLTLCKESKSANWFVYLDRNNIGVCYKKLECGWSRTSRVITTKDQLTRLTTQNVESLFIKISKYGTRFLDDVLEPHSFDCGFDEKGRLIKPVDEDQSSRCEGVDRLITKCGRVAFIEMTTRYHPMHDDFDSDFFGKRLSVLSDDEDQSSSSESLDRMRIFHDDQTSYPSLKHISFSISTDSHTLVKMIWVMVRILSNIDVETVLLDLDTLTTNQSIEFSDSVGLMPKQDLSWLGRDISECLNHMSKLKHLVVRGFGLWSYQFRWLTVLSIDLRSEANGDVLVRYLESDASNELREVGIRNYFVGTEQLIVILRRLKNVSSLRRLELDGFFHRARPDTQDGIDENVRAIVDLIVGLLFNLPQLYHVFIGCQSAMIKDFVKSKLKETDTHRMNVHLAI
ncbi:uncharacterized protein LOC141910914 [Tubulanus polymorphus]|uniref:uncharacterized protein LOC141910914 n=1 Tax=Tubulanus polymorphus TaxID=672921 RepID=UPI003DA22FDE